MEDTSLYHTSIYDTSIYDTSLYVTEEPAVTVADVDTCELDIKKTYELIPCIICSIGLLLGLIYCFLGYRCFKLVMFLSGFLCGSAAVFLLYRQEPVLGTQLGTQLGPETQAGIGLGVGVLCGLVTLLVRALGLLLTGLQLGALLALAALVAAGRHCSLAPPWVPLATLLACSVLCALLTLRWQKALTVAATSVLGAAAVVACVDQLLGGARLAAHLHAALDPAAPPPRPLCPSTWATAGLGPLLSLTGALVQWRLSARGVSHTKSVNKGPKQPPHTPWSGSRRRADPRRRRKPPPLKRYAGDVLAPSYLQSLRERQMGTGSSTDSTLSAASLTAVHCDFDTGSLVPLTTSSPVIIV